MRWGRRVVAALISVVCLAAAFTFGSSPAFADQTPARLGLFVMSADFGTVPVGTASATQTFNVINGGYTDTGLVQVAVVGANAGEFLIDGTTCRKVLVSGEICTVTVHFRPFVAGTRSAALSLSAMPGGTVQLPLTGVGGTAKLATGTVPPPFPSVVVGGTTGEQTVTFVNTGIAPSGPVLLNIAGANPGDFIRTQNTTCGKTLPVGGHCDVTVVFAPKAAGTRTATLTATANPGGSATATLSGTGLRPAQLGLAPAGYDFGFVTANKVVWSWIDIVNTGQVDSGPTTVTISGPDARNFAASSTCNQPVSPTGYCSITVYFEPFAVGHYQATLTVTGAPGGTVTAALRGAVASPAHLTISPATTDFGLTPTDGSSAPQKLTVTNTGETNSGTFSAGLVGQNWYDYHIDGTTCGSYVPAGGSCTVTVHFAPNATGTRFARLSVTGSSSGAVTADLFGTGFDRPQLAITPATTDFGSVVAPHSATKTLTVVNNGHAASGPVSVALTGANAAAFSIDSTDCGPALAPAARCSIVIHFTTGDTAGTATAMLTATATPGNTATAAVRGTTTLPPQFTWNQTGYAYTDLPVGTGSVHDFTVTNTGLHDSSFELVLDNQGPTAAMPFKIVANTCGTALAVGASCTMTVEFDAPDTVTHNAVLGLCPPSGGICPSTYLTGTGGVHSAHLTVSPPPDFGRVLAGSDSDDATITVVNDGVLNSSGPVTAKLTGANAADFTIDATTCTTLAVNQSCQLKVHFTPGALGDRIATLTVSAAPGGGHQVTLHGTGVDVAVTPAAFTFPDQPAGTTSATTDFVVTNHSSAPLTNLTVTSSDPMDFAIMGGTCLNATLPVGESCTVSVAFNAGAPGTYSSTFTAVYLAGGAPQTLTFAATGNATP